eukprot:TRINITY_DN388_c1_g1_i1.p1 TRINITY_DN388_c1_g1~~TRINITY_DN388_c1_g1_i1.p1  ORF type:complete len:186 (-),score=26.40 TRINITY_DN388_c1_g1_i1:47-604(-)
MANHIIFPGKRKDWVYFGMGAGVGVAVAGLYIYCTTPALILKAIADEKAAQDALLHATSEALEALGRVEGSASAAQGATAAAKTAARAALAKATAIIDGCRWEVRAYTENKMAAQSSYTSAEEADNKLSDVTATAKLALHRTKALHKTILSLLAKVPTQDSNPLNHVVVSGLFVATLFALLAWNN